MSVFVTRQGADRPVVIDIRRNAYVGHLIDAAIAKLGLHVVPDMAVLRLATSEAGELGAALDPCKSLITAWVHEESKLVIEVLAAAPAGAYKKEYQKVWSLGCSPRRVAENTTLIRSRSPVACILRPSRPFFSS